MINKKFQEIIKKPRIGLGFYDFFRQNFAVRPDTERSITSDGEKFYSDYYALLFTYKEKMGIKALIFSLNIEGGLCLITIIRK